MAILDPSAFNDAVDAPVASYTKPNRQLLSATERAEDGNLDLFITNASEQIFRGMMAALDLDADASSEGIHKGWMKVESSRLGIKQREAAETVLSNGKKGGSLGMVFRAVGAAVNDDEVKVRTAA